MYGVHWLPKCGRYPKTRGRFLIWLAWGRHVMTSTKKVRIGILRCETWCWRSYVFCFWWVKHWKMSFDFITWLESRSKDTWFYFFSVPVRIRALRRLVPGWMLIVGSLSESRLKSVRFLVGESNEAVTSYEAVKIIKINH